MVTVARHFAYHHRGTHALLPRTMCSSPFTSQRSWKRTAPCVCGKAAYLQGVACRGTLRRHCIQQSNMRMWQVGTASKIDFQSPSCWSGLHLEPCALQPRLGWHGCSCTLASSCLWQVLLWGLLWAGMCWAAVNCCGWCVMAGSHLHYAHAASAVPLQIAAAAAVRMLGLFEP